MEFAVKFKVLIVFSTSDWGTATINKLHLSLQEVETESYGFNGSLKSKPPFFPFLGVD